MSEENFQKKLSRSEERNARKELSQEKSWYYIREENGKKCVRRKNESPRN